MYNEAFDRWRKYRGQTSAGRDYTAEFHEARRSLFELSLTACRDQYKELSEVWVHLETKGQGNAAIAGIFIAGAFGYINGLKRSLHKYEQALLTASIVFLLLSVTFSLLVLRIRKVANQPGGEALAKMVKGLLNVEAPKELVERLPRFTNDQIYLWRIVNQGFEAANRSKARHLFIAQACLAGAMSMIALILVLAVFVAR